MFQDTELLDTLRNDSWLESTPIVAAEFNLNKASNIDTIGVYKNNASSFLPTRWNEDDIGILYAKRYTDDEIFVEITDDDYTLEFNQQKKMDLYYDIAECVNQNRPRSGINKILFRPGTYVDDLWSAQRPRYYWADATDKFKYWTSYRNYVDSNGVIQETGISQPRAINDAVPFVVYKNPVYANRIVVKIQTNYGNPVDEATVIEDPLQTFSNSSEPEIWEIQYLDEYGSWVKAYENPTVTADGHVEISYGPMAPLGLEEVFNFMGYSNVSSVNALDSGNTTGEAWILGQSTSSRGRLYVWINSEWKNYPLEFGFKQQEDYSDQSNVVGKIVNPRYVQEGSSILYPEFVKLRGLRIVVTRMLNENKTFDLIEMSPRLNVLLTDSTMSYDIRKTTGSDDGVLPVSGLLVSTGSVSLFNGDGAFNSFNTFNGTTGSVIAEHLLPGVKFYFWEAININNSIKYIPVKTLYTESWPTATSPTDAVNVSLRDAFFLFESQKTVDVLRQNMTLTGAVAWLLDSIGFSNYIFVGFGKGEDGSVHDPIIPFFFSNDSISVAETLNELCKSTQSMMYFDEYNNFIIASKDWVFNAERQTDFEFSGTDDIDLKANIKDVSANDRLSFNNGTVRYTERYVQRAPRTLSQAGTYDKYREYSYKPVLLWEVAGTDQTKTINNLADKQAGFALSAVVLKSNLSAQVPSVRNGQIVNNIIDIGETAYWLGRYNGYLYANNEIINYDAIEFAVPGQSPALVWIENNEQYQYYVSRMPFNGRIFPTGRIRIFTEVYYNDDGTIKQGAVKSHGRGQFQTTIVEHQAGLRDWWTQAANTKVIVNDSSYIFNEYAYHRYKYTGFRPDLSYSNIGNYSSSEWSISGAIQNMWAQYYATETGTVEKDPGVIQASALAFNGVSQPIDANIPLRNVLVSTTKPQNNATFVGARVRIIGKEENGLGGKSSTPNGEFSFDFKPREGSQAYISGGSCGISAFVNREKNTGYFFEIISYSADINNLINETDDKTDEQFVMLNKWPVLYNPATVINKRIDGTTAFLTTSEDHHFATGMQVVVSGVGAPYDGTFTITVDNATRITYNLSGYNGGSVTQVDSSGSIRQLGSGPNETHIVKLNSVEGIQNGFFVQNSAFPTGTVVLSTDANAKTVTLNSWAVEDVLTGDGLTFSKWQDPQATAVHNIVFYKMVPGTDADGKAKIVPIKLWGGLGQILIDQGIFVGQSRTATSGEPTVYDLGIEKFTQRGQPAFNLYINGRIIASVVDIDPLSSQVSGDQIINSGTYAGMFVRGSTQAMFENFMLIKPNQQGDTFQSTLAFNSILEEPKEFKIKNYQVSPFLQAAVSGISTSNYGNYTIDYEEFGTILRECAYFNVKYDQAYPALTAKLAPVVNNSPAYKVSNFIPGPYRAEFLVFNITDKTVVLDETSGNYLRILGVTFTQANERALAVDDYIKTTGSQQPSLYNELIASRKEYGEKSFDFNSMYIQDQDSAKSMMQWLLARLKNPKQEVEISSFFVPTLQLGDIVTVSYVDDTGTYIDGSIQMVVKEIAVSRSNEGPSMSVKVVQR